MKTKVIAGYSIPLWPLLVFAAAGILMVVMAVLSADKSYCGGVTQQYVDFAATGQLTNDPSREVFYDWEEDTLWIGGTAANGNISAYNLKKKTLEVCRSISVLTPSQSEKDKKASINKIMKWNKKVYFATDDGGVLAFDPAIKGAAGWKQYTTKNSGLRDNRIYAFAEDPRNHNLLATTWLGISSLDGEKWTDFDIVPPVEILNYHAILPISATEFFFGSINDGTVRYVEGRWELYDSMGIAEYVGGEWKTLSTTLLPNQVRDIKLTNDKRIAIAGDVEFGSGLFFLFGEQNKPYHVESPTILGSAFTHLTSVKAWNRDNFIVTNWSEGNGAGTYYQLQKGNDPVQLTELPSFATVTNAESAYIATSKGVIKVKLPHDSATVIEGS